MSDTKRGPKPQVFGEKWGNKAAAAAKIGKTYNAFSRMLSVGQLKFLNVRYDHPFYYGRPVFDMEQIERLMK